MAKKNKKGNIIAIVVGVVALLVLAFLLKANIYSAIIKYQDAGNRKSYEIKDETLSNYILQNLPNDESLDENMDIDMIIDFSLDITDKALDYSIEYKDSEPQKALANGGANYIGYAAFASAVGNYLINRYDMKKIWEAKPKKGKLHLFGNNMQKNATDGWFKDHDFVVFRNKDTKEEIYVDPAAFDRFGVRRVNKYQK
ncbi:hypothetical protein [Dysgonomonas sp. BGC7]|uniref:hypothetical protein n=1 Tax=Dysgonomonas sp. BGC7 TaxID=1658008 RepID=UPI000681AD7B|nr:hypothetical protein [Dysgonomonas sp. BGC7]MBD8389407.1 hypothetical protein [Dysgonomonas sp. BGC7]